MQNYLMLIINPGSTSTKIALFENTRPLKVETLRHDTKLINSLNTIEQQLKFRGDIILDFLKANNVDLKSIDCFVGRGGLLRPLQGGVYEINSKMKDDLVSKKYGYHASNLGGLIASDLANRYHKPSYIVNPVVVDEMCDLARVSGSKLMQRKSIFHALNQKAVAQRHAKLVNSSYDKLDLIVVHMGGGVSVGLHQQGKVVDVNNALDGDGPMSPERAGGVPAGALIDVCFSNKYTKEEIKKMLVGQGGIVSYLDTADMQLIGKEVEAGNKNYEFYMDAMIYQIVKEVGSLYFIAGGKIDGILFTGGIAYGKLFMDKLLKYIKPITNKIYVYPGEDEMLALAEGGYEVLTGIVKTQIY